MNRTHSPIGGRFSMFAPTTTGVGGTGASSIRGTKPSRLARSAGTARTGEEAFGQLEARQMLFVLFVPAGGATQATATYGYYSPYLFRQIPAFTAPERVDQDFEGFGVPQPVFPGSLFDTNPDTVERSLFVTHTGFPNPPTFPVLRRPIPTTPILTAPVDEVELNQTVTGTRTVTYTFAMDDTLRFQAMYAMEFTFFRPGAVLGTAPDTGTVNADSTLVTNNITIDLFLGTRLIATFDNSGAANTINLDAAITAPAPGANDARVLLRLDPDGPAVFDRAVIRARGAGDAFSFQSVTGEFPPGRFSQTADARAFGARARVTGASNGFLDAATVDPINRPDPVGASVNEIFDTDTGALNRRLATPTTFASGVQLRHANYAGGAEPQIVAGPGGGADRALSFTLTGTQTFSFRFNDALGQARPMPNFTFAVPNAGNQTLGAGTQIELLRNGRVVRTYQQADFDDPTVRITNAQDATQFIYVLDTATPTANFAADPDFPIVGQGAAFDEVRISRVGGAGTDAGGILIDRVSPFAPTMVEFFDLYGRPMINTLALIGTDSNPVPFSDVNDDGVPEFNDGIGRVVISNTTATSNFSIFGGEVAFDPQLGFQFVIPGSFTGNLDEYETAGLGHAFDPTATEPTPIGLNNGMGSVIIGAPFWRDNTNDIAYHGVDTTDPTITEDQDSILPNHADGSVIFPPLDLPLNRAADFSRVPIQDSLPGQPPVPQFQGIFTPLGTAVRNVNVHGVLYGTSDFGSSVATMNVGHLLGSMTVRGDLGALFVSGDSGAYFLTPTPATPANDGRGINATGSVINILRSLGHANFGSRNYARMTVFNDVNNPNLGRLQFAAYAEREFVPPFLGAQDPIATYYGQFLGGNLALQGNFGYRNDDFRAAEYVGHAGSFVTVRGTVGLLNDIQATDDRDTYAFSATRGVPIVVDATLVAATQGGQLGVVVVFDGSGREIARHELPFVSDDRINGGNAAVRFSIPGDQVQSDTYYIRVDISSDPNGANEQVTQTYTLAINGMASVGVGAISTVANSTNFIEVRGSMGLFRTGAGLNPSETGGVGMVAGHGSLETIEETDDLLEPHGGSLLVGGTLYTLLFGSDVEGGSYTVTGNLGSMRTGYFFGNPGGVNAFGPAAGIVPGTLLGQGDLHAIRLDVGGRIEEIQVHGDVGSWSDTGDYLDGGTATAQAGAIRIRTGLNGLGDGSIERFEVAGVLVGQATTLTLFGVNTGLSLAINGGIVYGSPTITFPDGGVLERIVVPSVPPVRPGIPTSNQFIIPLLFDVPLSLTADSGVQYTILITGGVSSRTSFGFITTVPVVGAPGAALGALAATLVGGAELRVFTTSAGRLNIGSLNITTLPPAVGIPRASSITFAGAGEIDISQVFQTRGAAGARDLDAVVNSTPRGDIGAMSVTGLNRLIVTGGNLGATPFPIRIPGLLDNPLGFVDGFDPAAPDDRGGTFGDGLGTSFRGLAVATGNVAAVQAAGFVRDVIVTGGDLLSLVVNTDNITGPAGFDGVIGRIQANNIVAIDLGHGLLGPSSSSRGDRGIFAVGSIGTVSASSRGGVRPVVNGVIIAANAIPPRAGLQSGINNIAISNGLVDGAFIGVSSWDSYFTSPTQSTPQPNDPTPNDAPEDRGIIRSISLTNTAFFRSEAYATSITNFNISGAAFDASRLNARLTIGNITASSFRNSTRDGEPLEYKLNQIFAGVSIARIATTGTGDISDLFVITDGSLLGGLSTRNATRLDLTVRQNMGAVSIAGDLRSSTLSVGNLASLSVAGDLRASTLEAAGPVNAVNVRGAATNALIRSTGINGRINSIVVGSNFQGSIISSGPINSVNVTGSLIGTVTTTDATDGDLLSIRSGGAMAATFSIARNVTSIFAGGSFGTRTTGDTARDIVDIQGTLGTLTATGQLYADIRVGQTINAITVGRVSATPANDLVGNPFITSFGRINAITITGDFNGNILSHSGGIGAITITNGSYRIGADDNNNGIIEATERNLIEVRDGDLGALTIANGSLFGNVVARDGDIRAINVSGAGAFGRIGVDPTLSTATAVTGDAFRNQLPPGTPVGGTVAFDGPTISAGRDILSINASGRAFEIGIFAGRTIGTVSTGGFNTDALGTVANSSYIAAGDTITSVVSRGQARGLTVLAGVTALGTDGRAGGAGADADTLKTGRVTTVTVTGGSDTVAITAGVNAGTDGLYNTLDGDNSETAVPGTSSIGTVTVTGGAIVATTAFADAALGTTSAGITRNNTAALPADVRTFTGSTVGFVAITATGLAITTTFGENARAVFTGPGLAFWDAANNRIVLQGSTVASSLRIDPIAPATALTTTLTNFSIVSGDDASLASLIINAQLRSNTTNDTADRNSRVFVDGSINNFQVGNTVITADVALPGSGIISAGQDILAARVGNSGVNPAANQFRLEGNNVTTTTVLGDLGTTSASRIDGRTIGTVSVTGNIRGTISSGVDISSVRASIALIGARIRAAGNLGTVTAASSSTSTRVSAGGNIQAITITGDANDSAFMAGTDLGTDGTFGGTGSAADRVTNGNIGSVVVTGAFQRSDITAGMARGTDGFVNTSDDIISDGRSVITSVRIVGQLVGSSLGSQKYGVISNGTIGSAFVGNTAFTVPRGNFSKIALNRSATPVQINDLRVQERAPRLYTARITVNQVLDTTTIAAALSIAEVRLAGQAEQLVPLVQGTDYTFRFEVSTNTLVIDFAETVTTRDLVGNTPGAQVAQGLFRFTLDAAVLRGATSGSGLDGNRDSIATGAADDYIDEAVVGDAGDRFVSGRTVFTDGNGNNTFVDFYGPASLDQLMDRNRGTDFLPDINRVFNLRGVLGDHADANTGTFGAGGDVDMYTITLRAGQILRLGGLEGSAAGAARAIYDTQGNALHSNQSGSLDATRLQLVASNDPTDLTETFVVRQSGTYILVMLPTDQDLVDFNPFGTIDPRDPTAAVGANTAGGTTGDYTFSVEIFDDGDSGFFSTLPAPDAAIATANIPVPADFAGADTLVGTLDDEVSVTANDDNGANPPYVFQLFSGADNTVGTADDVLIGTNGLGVFVTRTSGPNTTFGDGDDVVTFTRTSLAGASPVDPDAGGPLNAVPLPDDFRGVDNTFGTLDDIATITRTGTVGADFTFVLLSGTDGILGSADDIVRGANGQGIVSIRQAGLDLVFNTGDDIIRLTTSAGTGVGLLNPTMLPSAFAGTDNVLGTADDRASISIGDYIFTLDRGANRVFNGNGTGVVRSDDIVTGTRVVTGREVPVTSTRTAGADGQFGTADDVFTTTASGAVGDPGSAGTPKTGQLDVDVYHLNGGSAIAPGTRIRATLKLTEMGGNIGSLLPVPDQFGNVVSFRIIDNRGLVQFALFDTTDAVGLDDAILVAAPSNIVGVGGRTPGTTTDGSTTYGIDANGDYFMEFLAPPSVADSTRAGSFAIYVQGAVRSDYQVEVRTVGTGTLPTAGQSQNVLIDINGGIINWLEANPYNSTTLDPFDAARAGFAGEINGAPAINFFLQTVVANLTAAFAAAGINVTFSLDASAFEGQDFSTVFLTSSDPPKAFVNNGTFGQSQGVDIFNANRNDQAVVYATALNANGNGVGNAGAANFANQLTAAIGRRVGELLGLRLTGGVGQPALNANVDIMAANSPTRNLQGTGQFLIDTGTRPLAGQGGGANSTQFLFGSQRAADLLNRIFGNP